MKAIYDPKGGYTLYIDKRGNLYDWHCEPPEERAHGHAAGNATIVDDLIGAHKEAVKHLGIGNPLMFDTLNTYEAEDGDGTCVRYAEIYWRANHETLPTLHRITGAGFQPPIPSALVRLLRKDNRDELDQAAGRATL